MKVRTHTNRAIIHFSETPENMDIGVKEITEWHTDRGFETIGYHFVIRLDGTIELGRPLWSVGAHVKGQNSDSVAICYVGGKKIDGTLGDTRTPKQMESLELLIQSLRIVYDCLLVFGHNDYDDNKVCPGFDAKQEYN